jgi:hypothetical protein
MDPLSEKGIFCPYCGEFITILVDCSVSEQSYTEDCQVCCQPILLHISFIEDDEINVTARREDD